MDIQKKSKVKVAVLLVLALSLGLNSCKKTTEGAAPQDGSATVIVNMLGVESAMEPLAPAKGKFASANNVGGTTAGVQKTVIPFDEYTQIVATLVPEGTAVGNGANGSLNRIAATGPVRKVSGIVVRDDLEPGRTYRILAYDKSDGSLVADRTYVRGNESDYAEPLKLDAGKPYVFMAVGGASETALTDVDNLASASVMELDSYGNSLLSYFRREMTLTDGNNNLDIILKRQFSEITTTLTVDGSIPGNLTAIDDVWISPAVYPSATLKLSDGVLTFGEPNLTGRGVGLYFPVESGGTRSIQSSTPVINSGLENTTLTIGSITIDGVTKTNLSFPINIMPGFKYNLNLTFQAACTADVTIGPFTNSALPEVAVPERTGTFEGNLGLVLNIASLDNSFNLSINGTPLITNSGGTDHEIQFDQSVFTQNIQFEDGTTWEEGGNPEAIWLLTGTFTNPIIRVVVSPAGNVTMFGIKSNGGALLPLVLTNDYTFNDMTLNPGTNTFALGQAWVGAGNTALSANLIVTEKVPCNP